jgi:hypothetical protein
MSYERHIAAMSFGDLKAASLYFDRVLPIAFASLRGDDGGLYLEAPDRVPIEIAAKLIFGEDAPRHLIISYLDDYWSPFIRQLGAPTRNSTDHDAYDEVKRLYLSNAAMKDGRSIRGVFGNFARSMGVPAYSVLLPGEDSVTSSFSEAYSYLALLEIPLVDTSKATWEQIAELRRDPEARGRLRRLRMFFLQDYVGKPRAYVEDDLLRRLDDYERTRKELGFEAILSTLSVLLDAKSVQAAAVAGLTATFLGGPLVGLGVGAAVEIGKVILEAGKKIAHIRSLADGHELAYLIDARRRVV